MSRKRPCKCDRGEEIALAVCAPLFRFPIAAPELGLPVLLEIGSVPQRLAVGIGLAASGNINPTQAAPSMFEPVHGSAPDIAGTVQADPTATILSVAMLLAHIGAERAAADLERAVAADLLDRRDIEAPRSTRDIAGAVLRRVSG